MTGKTWLAIGLALSLLFNMAALGVGVRLWQARETWMGASSNTALSRPLQRQMLVALAQHRGELAPLLQDLRAAREAAVQAAEAQPFDRVRTEAALTDLRDAVGQLMEAAQIIVLDSLQSQAGG
jgi:uncharacterized membrane protein